MLHKNHKEIGMALLFGLLTIIIINSITSFIVFQRVKGFIAGDSLMDSFIYNRFVLTIVSLLTPIIGGFVVGYLLKKKGAFYGAILGGIIKLISLVMISTVYFYPHLWYGTGEPTPAMHALAQKNLFRQLLSLPFTVLFVAWGGWMGELFRSCVHDRNK